jgi:hypothetical protein
MFYGDEKTIRTIKYMPNNVNSLEVVNMGRVTHTDHLQAPVLTVRYDTAQHSTLQHCTA